MRKHFQTALCGVVLGVLARPASGHVPVFSDGSAIGPDTAIEVEDVSVSRVVYAEITPSAPQLWITFIGQAGQEVPFRLGVPFIPRLSDFRPALAVLGPGLPPVQLPFDVPAGLGGVVLEADPAAELEFFHEEFTGTDSWIVGDLNVRFPQDGRYSDQVIDRAEYAAGCAPDADRSSVSFYADTSADLPSEG
jgi:hypothetical protein